MHHASPRITIPVQSPAFLLPSGNNFNAIPASKALLDKACDGENEDSFSLEFGERYWEKIHENPSHSTALLTRVYNRFLLISL